MSLNPSRGSSRRSVRWSRPGPEVGRWQGGVARGFLFPRRAAERDEDEEDGDDDEYEYEEVEEYNDDDQGLDRWGEGVFGSQSTRNIPTPASFVWMLGYTAVERRECCSSPGG